MEVAPWTYSGGGKRRLIGNAKASEGILTSPPHLRGSRGGGPFVMKAMGYNIEGGGYFQGF